ncbi:MAG: DUF5640 domain-containing protein [Clostridiales bacterium]|nr:DUF5640 domain-containing protein [Clostridiales bacterium]
MAKKALTKKAKIIIGVIVGVIVALVAAGGIYCVATDQNPVEATKSIFSSDETKLVAKWQSQSAAGLSAYVFYDDGTYDSYLSTINFSGTYTVKGNKLTLKNPETSKEIIYKFSISGKVLTLTLLEEDGKEAEESDVSKYDQVDELNQKTLSDLISDLQSDNEDEEEEEEEEETTEEETEEETDE